MKTFVALFLILAASASAQATELDSAKVFSLPQLSNSRIVTDRPARMLAVQPRSFVVFDYVSCSQRDFTVLTSRDGQVTYVSVELTPNTFDCMGNPTQRTYKLQVTSDAQRDHTFVVLNPIAHAAE
jgi:hypothetical protein